MDVVETWSGNKSRKRNKEWKPRSSRKEAINRRKYGTLQRVGKDLEEKDIIYI